MKQIAKILLLCLAIVMVTAAVIFLKEKQETKALFDRAYHKTFYQEAQGTWDADLAIGPSAPQIILETKIGSSTQLHLTWSKPAQSYNHFLITVTDPITQWSRTESGEHERVSLDVSELVADREYVMVVRACLDPDCRAWKISQTETRGKTFPEYWQVASTSWSFENLRTIEEHRETLRHPRTKKLPVETEREGWQTSVLKHRLKWIWESNLPLEQGDVDKLIIDRVVIEGDPSRQRLNFKIDENSGYAVLVNP